MLQVLITSIITVVLGWVTIWIKNRFQHKQRMESERDLKKREAFEKMLQWFSERPLTKSVDEGELRKLVEMSREMAVWAPDDVLVHYAIFLEKRFPNIMRDIKAHEIHFGKAILAFRRERGFLNRDNKLKPRQVVAIFKAGWKTPL